MLSSYSLASYLSMTSPFFLLGSIPFLLRCFLMRLSICTAPHCQASCITRHARLLTPHFLERLYTSFNSVYFLRRIYLLSMSKHAAYMTFYGHSCASVFVFAPCAAIRIRSDKSYENSIPDLCLSPSFDLLLRPLQSSKT
ncbi:hypothetical protein BDQ17DRAFT_662735 [Cyathus striatus]|nr:hypothetical protein BDQ17DRAFT_662735 [Cyathus striatus]